MIRKLVEFKRETDRKYYTIFLNYRLNTSSVNKLYALQKVDVATNKMHKIIMIGWLNLIKN